MLTVASPHATIMRYWPDECLSRMFIPQLTDRVGDSVAEGVPLVADNGAFKNFDEALYMKMLAKLEGAPVQWVTAPDVVGDAEQTEVLFDKWEPIIRSFGLPVAFVTQNGLENLEVPWDRLDCIFLGGDDYHKTSDYAWGLTREAKQRGKHTHMGRVNVIDRFQLARCWGSVDSVDGSKFAIYNEWWLRIGLDWCKGIPTVPPKRNAPPKIEHPSLFEEAV